MINYGRAMRKYGVTLPKPPEMPASPYEHEYKFLIEGNEQHARETFNLIQLEAESGGAFLKETGFKVREESEKRSRQQVDLYFDDKQLTLYSSGVSFRLRERRDVMRVTLKKRLPVSEQSARHEGLYERIEEEAVITEPQKHALLEGKQINVFPYRLIAYVAPQCRSIWPKLKVVNRRQVLILEDSDHRKVEMCLDEVTYEPPLKGGDVLLPPYFEIELESKGAPRDSVERLARHLETDLGLKPSLETKYQRGITLLKGHDLFR
jgi:inorganic triphosphatase YgiF